MALMGALSSCGSSPPPPPPRGLVEEELARLPDPIGAVRERIAALESWGEAYAADAEAPRVLARLAREIAGLLGRKAFDPVPLLAARLRTRIFFALSGNPDERRAAVAESRRLLEAIEKRLEGSPESGGETGSP